MNSSEQPEKDKSKKIDTEGKIPAELKSMMNSLYYDTIGSGKIPGRYVKIGSPRYG